MFVRAYLRASTKEQDADRARQQLIDFAAERGHKIASFYVENESGSTLNRPELMRMIEDAHEGDVILVEQIDRLARLRQEDWQQLRNQLASKRLAIVSPELPTSWAALQPAADANPDEFAGLMLKAVNNMLLDMLAAVARKDYEDRRRRQAQGIEKAKTAGKYRGRPVDSELHGRISKLLRSGMSYTDIQQALSCSRKTIAAVSKQMKQEGELMP